MFFTFREEITVVLGAHDIQTLTEGDPVRYNISQIVIVSLQVLKNSNLMLNWLSAISNCNPEHRKAEWKISQAPPPIFLLFHLLRCPISFSETPSLMYFFSQI